MKFSQQDFDEVGPLAGLLKKIDIIDATYVNLVSDEIFKRQPFFLSVLLGYHLDLAPAQMEEVMKVYFIIWEYFKKNKNVQTRVVTEDLFERIQRRNIQMLNYAEGEPSDHARKILYGHDMQKIQSKSLMTAVLFRFNERPDLVSMDEETKGIVLMGIKTFIECFETI